MEGWRILKLLCFQELLFEKFFFDSACYGGQPDAPNSYVSYEINSDDGTTYTKYAQILYFFPLNQEGLNSNQILDAAAEILINASLGDNIDHKLCSKNVGE